VATPWLAAAAVGAGTAAQAVTGVGFSLVSAPFLVTAYGPREGVRVAILLSVFVNLAGLVREHRRVDVRAGVLLLVPALVATPMVAWVVRRAPVDVLSVVAGVLIVLSAALLASGFRLRAAGGRGGAVVAGMLSATTNVLSGVGGPPVVLYTANAGWAHDMSRATLQSYFLMLNLAALVSLGVPHIDRGLPVALVVGWVIGLVLDRVVSDRVALRLTLALAAVGGLVTVVRALT
jgi:uncharacterized membrane protein YfcA